MRGFESGGVAGGEEFADGGEEILDPVEVEEGLVDRLSHNHSC